jgi:hypothetical protein
MWCRRSSIVVVLGFGFALGLGLTSVVGAQPGATPPTSPEPIAPAAAPVTPAAPVAPAAPMAAPPEPAPRPERFMVGLGLLVGGSDKRGWLYGAVTIEAGVTILPAPVHVRVRGFANLTGGTVESDWGGDFARYGGGFEARLCAATGPLCGFVDLDAGYQKLTLYDNYGDLARADRGLLIGPRIGADVGGLIRFRIAVELYRQFTDAEVGSFNARGLSLALSGQF